MTQQSVLVARVGSAATAAGRAKEAGAAVGTACALDQGIQQEAAGARWDPHKIQWYAPPGTNLSPLETWIKHRIYLQCDFKDKTTVVEHGARWDRLQQSWYITSDMDKSPFRSWLCEDSRG